MHIAQAAMRPVMSRTMMLRGAKFYRSPAPHTAECSEQPAGTSCICGAHKAPAVVMFVNHMDASSREGPREATDQDAQRHPDAFAKFQAEDAAIQAGRPHAPDVELAEEPLRPLLVWVDPEDYEPPKQREKGPHEQKRDQVLARAQAAAGE